MTRFFALRCCVWIVLALMPGTVSAGVTPAAGNASEQAVPDPPDARAIRLFGEAIALVRAQYVAPVDENALVEVALKAMLGSLDGHSSYMTPKEYSALDESLRGEFGGIGLVVAVENGVAKAISPVDGGPAARAGIEAGAVITQIDGRPASGLSLGEVVSRLRGAKGTRVTLTLKQGDMPPIDVSLLRETIKLKSVHERPLGSFGYVRIVSFEASTPADFVEAIGNLKHGLPAMKGLILDLRNNPGGLFDAAVGVASPLLAPGEDIVLTGRDPREVAHASARPPANLLPGVPIVVLINNGSASSAEIVTGALQDNHRALVVGMTSWGKGLVQDILPLNDGRDGALSVTTRRYYTPSGHSIQKLGIIPDLQVARSDDEVKNAYNVASAPSEATLANALDNESHLQRQPPRAVEVPLLSAQQGRKPALLFTHAVPDDSDVAGDFQLQRAVDLLTFGSVDQARVRKPARIYQTP